MQDCRLIIEDSGSLPSSSLCMSGAMNMSVDETLLRSAAERDQATLRFYGWQPATLSIGYFQQLADRKQHSASLPCDVVRRASGGGAIMHEHELTYAFAFPTRTRWGEAEQMYLTFHETLVDVLAELGIQTQLHSSAEGLTNEAFLCFQRRASGDVTFKGHKVMGSAQRRSKNALLQHGSLLLAKSVHAPELPGLKEIAGVELETAKLIPLWLHKLTPRLKVNFLEGELTDMELKVAQSLTDERFSHHTWVTRR